MRKLFFSLLVVFTIIYASSSSHSLPDWVIFELDKYPSEIYLFDVGRSEGTGEGSFEIAAAKAYKNTAKRILKEVSGIIRLNEGELQHGMVFEHYSSVLENYYTSHQEPLALQLDKKGFSVQNLSVDLARTDQYTYALVYITRAELREIYTNRASDLRRRIKYRLEIAAAAERDLDIEGAVKTYLQTYTLYEELKEAEIIQIAAQYGHAVNFSDFRDAFRHLADAATDTSDNFWTHRQVIKRVEKLNPQIVTSIDDISSVIKFQFLQQRAAFRDKVFIAPLTYEDSGVICPFAPEFSTSLQKKLGWTVVDEAGEFTPPRLSPFCWENGDEITIRATLRDVHTGEFLASGVVQFLNSQLRKPLNCKLNNYQSAQVEKRAFTPRYYEKPRVLGSTETSTPKGLTEHQVSPVGALKVEVWTNKGSSPMYYTKGETMKVFGRVNQPAYLRLLYILADGKRTLLQDNYYIDASDVDSNVKIGEFVCTPPFGAEMLVVAARTESFPPIKTYEKNGYIYLTDQDAESAARSFRGMQQIQDKNDETETADSDQSDAEQLSPDFQQSESQLVITTMKK